MDAPSLRGRRLWGAYLAAFCRQMERAVDFTLAIPVLVTLGAIGTCVGYLWTALKEDVPGK
jgi:hypothetical protein